MLRIALIVGMAIGSAAPSLAQVAVDGHYRTNGTYVQPHVRSAPNSSTYDNYSTQGNVNPYTGRQGTKDPYDIGSTYGSSSSQGRCSGLYC